MSRVPKSHTTQIRPSVEIDTAITLEALQKGKPLGKVIEELLNDSPKFKAKKEELKKFKE